MKYVCALIEFTPQGHVEHFVPDLENGISASRLEGYERPESWRPCEDTQYPDRMPVLDKRPPLEDGIGVLLRAPVLRLADPFKDDAAVNAVIERLSTGNWNLRKCGLEGHLAYWIANGARLGHLIQGRIVWDGQNELAAS